MSTSTKRTPRTSRPHGRPPAAEPRVTKVESMLTTKEGEALERARKRQAADAGTKLTRSDYIRLVLREHLGFAS